MRVLCSMILIAFTGLICTNQPLVAEKNVGIRKAGGGQILKVTADA